MLNKKSEKGQAIIMIVFAIIGVIGLIALTVDGGMAFMDRRHAQGAADSAAWAAGLTNARTDQVDLNKDGSYQPGEINTQPIIDAAMLIANQNSYTDDKTHSVVDVTVKPLPIAPEPVLLSDGTPVENPCPDGASPNVEITVTITSYVHAFFAPVIGVDTITNKVSAVTRACGKYIAPIFGGNAIVSLNDKTCKNATGGWIQNCTCAFDSGNSNAADWTIKGGGLFSNGCAKSKDSGSVTLDPLECVATVGVSEGFASNSVCPEPAEKYPKSYVDSIMPPNPCTGAITSGVYAGGGKVPTNGQTTFSDGVYCISNMDALDGKDVILNNATLYVTDKDFDLKFAGGGGFYGTPTSSGTYSSYAIVVAPNDSPCQDFTPSGGVDAQVMEYRGSSSGQLYGTILAPTACIDLRGNAGNGHQDDPLLINSQVIAYTVSSNGNASITIEYKEEQNRREPEVPKIELVQ